MDTSATAGSVLPRMASRRSGLQKRQRRQDWPAAVEQKETTMQEHGKLPPRIVVILTIRVKISIVRR
jgi:hypothetical protein